MASPESYKMLAIDLALSLPKAEINKILAGDKKIITKLLKEECRDLDWHGRIIDTLWSDLSSIPDARWVKLQVESVADRLVSRFDFARLREYLTLMLSNK